jgi:hypothetical protein
MEVSGLRVRWMRMVEMYGFPNIAAEIERLTDADDGPWTPGDLN